MQGGFGASPIELMTTDAMLRGELYATGFTYGAQWVGTNALGASISVDSNIQINADSDFVVQEMNLVSFTAADTPETNPDYLVNIVIAGSGRQIMNQPQHVMNYFGAFAGTNSLQEFNRVPMPMLLPSNTGVTITLTNRSAVASVFAQVTFRGYKVFYLTGNRANVYHVL